MIKATLKTLLASAVGTTALSLAVSMEPAQALRVSYDFTVNVPTGEYAGSHQGSLSFDDTSLTGKSLEFVTPSNGNLTILFNLLGRIYTEQNDSEFNNVSNQFPKAFFENGVFLGLSYLVLPFAADPGFMIVADKSVIPGTETKVNPGFYVGNPPNPLGNLTGNVNYSLVVDNSAAVPEPSEIAGGLLALGLLGVGLKLRRRGSSTFKP